MNKNKMKEVVIPKQKNCDFCTKEALYDDKTTMGPWAYLCQDHETMLGLEIGFRITPKGKIKL